MNRVDFESCMVKQRNLNFADHGVADADISMNSCPTSQDDKWIHSSLNPLLKYMKVCGLYFEIQSNSKSMFLGRYALLMTVLGWMNALRMLTVFAKDDSLGPILFWKLSLTIWMTSCAFVHTTWYYACKTGKFQNVLRET